MASRTPTVVVVEDDTDIREALIAIVEGQGVAVRAARDGAEGLDLVRASPPPDAVFLDRWLPKFDGATVLAMMKSDPALSTIPIVWMSADPECPAAAARHLAKPFDMDAFVEMLSSVCAS